jgi:hypothetical protein
MLTMRPRRGTVYFEFRGRPATIDVAYDTDESLGRWITDGPVVLDHGEVVDPSDWTEAEHAAVDDAVRDFVTLLLGLRVGTD